MVSPHAASLREPVTYTRASCEIWGGVKGGGGERELTKMHILAAAQLSPPPLQPSPSSPALPAMPRAFPACCHHARSNALGVCRVGQGTLGMQEHPTSCIPHPTSCILHAVEPAECPKQALNLARSGHQVVLPKGANPPGHAGIEEGDGSLIHPAA